MYVILCPQWRFSCNITMMLILEVTRTFLGWVDAKAEEAWRYLKVIRVITVLKWCNLCFAKGLSTDWYVMGSSCCMKSIHQIVNITSALHAVLRIRNDSLFGNTVSFTMFLPSTLYNQSYHWNLILIVNSTLSVNCHILESVSYLPCIINQ